MVLLASPSLDAPAFAHLEDWPANVVHDAAAALPGRALRRLCQRLELEPAPVTLSAHGSGLRVHPHGRRRVAAR